MSEKNSFNQALYDALMNAQLPQIKTTVGGKFSFGVVNSRQNGKRVSFSQELVKKLDLIDIVYAMPSVESRQLVIGKVLPFPSAALLELKGEGKKIAYAAHFVEMVTEIFSLDFSKHVSQTFYNIDFNVIDGTPVAIINFPAAKSAAVASTVEEIDSNA